MHNRILTVFCRCVAGMQPTHDANHSDPKLLAPNARRYFHPPDEWLCWDRLKPPNRVAFLGFWVNHVNLCLVSLWLTVCHERYESDKSTFLQDPASEWDVIAPPLSLSSILAGIFGGGDRKLSKNAGRPNLKVIWSGNGGQHDFLYCLGTLLSGKPNGGCAGKLLFPPKVGTADVGCSWVPITVYTTFLMIIHDCWVRFILDLHYWRLSAETHPSAVFLAASLRLGGFSRSNHELCHKSLEANDEIISKQYSQTIDYIVWSFTDY